MVEVTCHFTLNKYRYSEQINFVNLWLDKQAIGFIFPIHYSEQINFVNLWLASKPSDLSFRFHTKNLGNHKISEVLVFF